MADICENCGAKLNDNAKFCPECGVKIDEISYCPECGSKLKMNDDFCSECGYGINEKPKLNIKDNKIIMALIIIIIVLLVSVALFISGTFTNSDIELGTKDFGGITMSVPVGSNFVETDSLPATIVGGYIQYENAGKYSRDAFSVMFSTIKGGSHPPETVLDRQSGDITIYKDRNGEDGLYMTREVGDVEVSLIGNNEKVMIDMLNSVKITSTYQVQ